MADIEPPCNRPDGGVYCGIQVPVRTESQITGTDLCDVVGCLSCKVGLVWPRRLKSRLRCSRCGKDSMMMTFNIGKET